MNGNLTSLKIATLSDVHLGHRKNPTERICENIYRYFPDDAVTAQLDVIFIAGDLFDDLLNFPDADVGHATLCMVYLLRLCKKYDIRLRVLEGTPLHDREQSQHFVTHNEGPNGIGADLLYVKTLHVEIMPDSGLSVIYLPDEYGNNAERIVEEARELIAAKGLNRVDVAVMHGAFEYQLPAAAPGVKHNPEAWLELVRYLIFIGHVHDFSTYDRIIAQGSFDRLGHGYESAKGHVRATLYPDGTYEAQFVENEGAMIFKTMDCVGLTYDQTMELLDEAAAAVPPDSRIRINAAKDNPIFENMAELYRRHPFLYWDKNPVAVTKEEEEEVIEDTAPQFIPITLTPDNLSRLLLERMAVRADPEVVHRAAILLEEIINE